MEPTIFEPRLKFNKIISILNQAKMSIFNCSYFFNFCVTYLYLIELEMFIDLKMPGVLKIKKNIDC